MTLFVFNPEHDLCMANGDPNFVPPQSALQFADDCCELMQWLGGVSDVCVPANRVGEALLLNPMIDRIEPWGWDMTLAQQLRKQHVPEELILGQSGIGSVLWGSHRARAHFAAEYLRDMNRGLGRGVPLSESCSECSSLDEVEQFVYLHHDVVLKSVLSGSGQGLRPVRDSLSDNDKGWVRNNLRRHHTVMAERRYDVVENFAVLFDVSLHGVYLKGYSLFETNGFAYQSNLMLSDEEIRTYLSQLISLDMLDTVVEDLRFYIERRYCANVPPSYMGVDMFLYRPASDEIETFAEEHPLVPVPQYFLNPVVEINFRPTMGLVAHEWLRRCPSNHGKRFYVASPTDDNPHYTYGVR